MSKLIVSVAALVTCLLALNGELVEQECPDDCECHYFRINWVTDCSESNLTFIPYEELSHDVYVLDMNGNNIKHVAPFPPDIKLRRLQMAHNLLTELTYESFAGLTYLLDADFASNAITKIDPDAFRDSPGLITLELQNNPLEEIDGPLLNCSTLQYLDLNSCGIRRLNTQFFHNTANLNKLDLSHNPLGKLESSPFDELINLEYLKLVDCNITYISPETFSHLENLRELELGNNKLKTINWARIVGPLVRLELLDIRNTSITNLPGDAFATNLYLTTLILVNNELSHLDVENTLGHNLHTLQSLDLSYCNLEERLSEEAFRNASHLRSLNLSGNPMFASDLTAVLRHLPKLHKLSLSNCSLNKLPVAFEILENLEELDISYNPLEDVFVKLLKPLKSLEFLDMSYCHLGYVSNNTFELMTSLKKLIMSGNELHTLERSLFENLTSLESLELNNCGLKNAIDPRVFGDSAPTNIIELKLSGNPLVIPTDRPLLPKQLSSLEILDLSNCSIGNLNYNVFDGTRNLTNLNLSNNKISGENHLSFLKTLPFLRHLDMSNNNLSTITPKVLKANTKLMTLNLKGNPFVCNCSIVDMWNWAVQIKKDLHVLIGSKPSEFSTTAAKLRKGLSCTYDAETYQTIVNQTRGPSERKSGRQGSNTPNRTWAKFVRESNCPKKA